MDKCYVKLMVERWRKVSSEAPPSESLTIVGFQIVSGVVLNGDLRGR
jgi:hypothetical protein